MCKSTAYKSTACSVFMFLSLSFQIIASAISNLAISAVGTSSLQPERTQRTAANSRRTALREQPFSRTYCCWRCVCNVPVSNLDTLDRGEDDEKLKVRIVRLRTFSTLPEAVTSPTVVIIEFSFCGSKLVGMERVNFIHDLGALIISIPSQAEGGVSKLPHPGACRGCPVLQVLGLWPCVARLHATRQEGSQLGVWRRVARGQGVQGSA